MPSPQVPTSRESQARCQWLDTIRALIPWAVDIVRNRFRNEEVIWARGQTFQPLSIGCFGIKPLVGLPSLDDERHAFVNRLHQLVGFCSDDGASFQWALFTAFIAVPQARKKERHLVGPVDPERLFAFAKLLPFVESIGWNETTMPSECRTEGRLGRNRFLAGIQQAVTDLLVCSPGRDQSPAQENAFALAVGSRPHCQDSLRWCDVV